MYSDQRHLVKPMGSGGFVLQELILRNYVTAWIYCTAQGYIQYLVITCYEKDSAKEYICMNVYVFVCVLSLFTHVWLCATLWTIVPQAPLSMGFSRQEYSSGLPCPHPGDPPDLGIEPVSLRSPALAGRFFTTSATWEARVYMYCVYICMCVYICVCVCVCV